MSTKDISRTGKTLIWLIQIPKDFTLWYQTQKPQRMDLFGYIGGI